MTKTSFSKDNHYVSQGYLKRWSSSHEKVWTYRVVVSHEQVPQWKESSIEGVAKHLHLYTRIAAGGETDEMEKWFNQEFETPAEEVLRKVTSDERLTPTDWKCLVRFLAAQDVRTPARLAENLKYWHTTLPDLMDQTLQESVRKLELAKASGETLPQQKTPFVEYIPFRVMTEIDPDQRFGKLKYEAIVGRGMWLFSIRHLLTQTACVLYRHKWTILSPPEDMRWITSDDPVIRLNFHSPVKYDFDGGWGSQGTEILLPLSPHHLLYTQIGSRPPRRGDRLPRDRAEMILRFIAEHAHRMIFAAERDAAVPKLRPRTVSADIFRDERMQWNRWHDEQTTAERELMSKGNI
ncbi:MAG: DUF4238 domain-containing protein [Planctomycetes bacterium]|nr:DUF4238 domain-containing protein [Planctomycetota bacterium]